MHTYSAQPDPAYDSAGSAQPRQSASVTPLYDGDPKQVRAAEEAEILATFRRRFNLAKEHSRDWREEARTLYDLRAGHHWTPEDAAQLREELRPMVTFNVADKYIDAVNGLQINNRQEIRYFPRELGDAKVNELLTGSVKYCRDETDAADEETDAFVDLAVTGMGWHEGFWDEEMHEEGIAAKDRRDPLEMYWDPYARKRNLRDRKWQCRIRLMDSDEFEEKFPEADITGAVDSDLRMVVTEFDSDDTGIEVIERPQDYERDFAVDGMPRSRARLAVADYQYREPEWKYDVRTARNELRDLTKAECSKLKRKLEDARIPYSEAKRKSQCYYRCFIAGNRILRRTKLPHGFTYFCLTGKRDRNTNTWYGLGRGLQDPQMWVNKFFSQILHVINTNAKGGLIVEEDVFTDPRKAEAEWAAPNSITHVKQNALAEARIKEKTPARYPEGMDRLMVFALSMLPQVSGLNPEVMGLADRDQPGILEAQRKQAALAIIAWLFDALRLHYKEAGRWYAQVVRDFMADGRLIRINGPDGAQYLPLLRDRMTFEYDVIVDEAPTSVNMKERVWAALQTALPIAAQMGAPIPKEVLDYLPIPTDLAQAWKKQSEPTPEQQQAKQLEVQAKQAEIAQDQADAQKKTAEAQKIIAELGQGQQGTPVDANVALQGNIDAQLLRLEMALKGQLEGMKQSREGETKLTLEAMRAESAERIAALQASIQLMVGALTRNGGEGEDETEGEEPDETPAPDPVLTTLERMVETLEKLRGPRKVIYNDKGDIAGVE